MLLNGTPMTVSFLSIILLLFFSIFPIITVKAATYTDIDVNTAYNMINNNTLYPGLIILDVREKYEYDIHHIQDAILIPLGEINARINELEPYIDTEIIVYCRSGSRSASASQNLAGNHNFTKIFNMGGGINAWIAAGYPVIEGNIELPPIDFTFLPFIVVLVGTIGFLLFYFRKHIYKKKI
ncbi:MAG: rhodanese-like domain-containing protein, partial [Candidatus Thorarchaeota archaeon]